MMGGSMSSTQLTPNGALCRLLLQEALRRIGSYIDKILKDVSSGGFADGAANPL